MFDAHSRYAKVPIVDVETRDGKTVRAVMLRRLPEVPGHLIEVKGTDRLDLMAQRNLQDGTKFWRIADANTELEANQLVETGRSTNPLVLEEVRHIRVPED